MAQSALDHYDAASSGDSGLPSWGWRRLRLNLAVALCGIVGIALSFLFCWLLLRQEQRLAEVQFHNAAARRIDTIQAAMTDRLGALRILAAYYAGSELVERHEFRTFTKPLLEEFPGIEAFGWAPRIPAAQRQAHEQFARGEGVKTYRITERNKQGRFVPAGRQAEYWPILFIEPARENKKFFGFDVESNPTYRAALRQTTATGRPAAGVCDPIETDKEGNPLVYVVMPAKNEVPPGAKRPGDQPTADGFIFALFDVKAIVNSALASTPPIGIDVSITAPLGPGGKEIVYNRPARLRSLPGATVADRTQADLRLPGQLAVADSRWKIECIPVQSCLGRYLTWGPICILLLGISVTALLVGCLLLLLGHTARIERVVAQRTRELRESEQRFRRLVDNAGDTVILHAQKDTRILDLNRHACESLGYSREELLSMTIADVDPDFIPKNLAQYATLPLAQYPVTFEGRHRRKDGSTFPVEIRLTALDSAGQRVMLGVARDITERKRAEKQLDDERRRLQTMLDMHERERKLIAYEIHDGLAQDMVGAVYKFQSIEPLRDSDPQAARELFDEALRLLRQAMAETRRLISGLRPPILEESGVIDALDFLIAEQRQRGGPQIEFLHPDQFDRLPPLLESAIFRTVQECLTNACRYSQSEKVRIELARSGDRLQIDVRDWGIGFDPPQVGSGHYGLDGIRQRAQVLGGSALIDAAPGNGARIHVELPLPPRVGDGTAAPIE